MSGYHSTTIDRGVFGEFSKIREEFEEAKDAYETMNPVMLLQELSDLLGAIEGYTLGKYNINLSELYRMTQVTRKVFEEGYRESR